MRKLLLLTLTLLAAGSLQARQWTPEQVRQVIRKVNTYWQQNNKAEVRAFWDNAAYHTGNIEVYKLMKDDSMLDYSIRWATHNQWQGATEPDPAKWKYKHYGEGHDFVLFGDWQICFQTYIDLYNLAPDEQKVARAKQVMGYEADSKVHDYWWWADALYMVMPVMTKMYQLTGDKKYLDKLYENLLYSDSIMLDSETGLYFRDGKYVWPNHKSRCCKTCPRPTSGNPSSCISTHAWPVRWPSASSRKAIGPAPCSTRLMPPAPRPAGQPFSATDCCGASTTATCRTKSSHPSSSGRGNTSPRLLCSATDGWAMCSPLASVPSPDRPSMPTVRLISAWELSSLPLASMSAG